MGMNEDSGDRCCRVSWWTGRPLPCGGEHELRGLETVPQRRQFTYAADVASAFNLARRSEAQGMALNVVAPETTSITELAGRVVDRYPTELTFGEARADDVPSSLVTEGASQ